MPRLAAVKRVLNPEPLLVAGMQSLFCESNRRRAVGLSALVMNDVSVSESPTASSPSSQSVCSLHMRSYLMLCRLAAQ